MVFINKKSMLPGNNPSRTKIAEIIFRVEADQLIDIMVAVFALIYRQDNFTTDFLAFRVAVIGQVRPI